MLSQLTSRSAITSAQRKPSFAATTDISLDTFVPSNGSSQSAELDFHAAGRRHRNKSRRSSRSNRSRRTHEELTSSFVGREGYDKNFLGVSLPLPKIAAEDQSKVATLIGQPNKSELEYTNFSIVMNKERRQAFFTAVNIDGAKIVSVPRKGKWTIDSRIPREHQLGNEAYRNNPVDRGHMVRRRDPVWGDHPNRASNDTFVYTNAGLQLGRLNQKEWLDLENHVLEQAKQKDAKYTVMTGPVLADDDPAFDNGGKIKPATQIPQEFWKLVVWNDEEEGLKGAAFIQSQKNYMGSSLFKSDFDAGPFEVYQVPIEKLAEATNLDFGDIANVSNQPKKIKTGSDATVL